MEDILEFSGPVTNLTVDTAPLTKSGFSLTEGIKSRAVTARYTSQNRPLELIYSDRKELYSYNGDQLTEKVTIDREENIICREVFEYQNDRLHIMKRYNSINRLTEEYTHSYNDEDLLICKESRTLKYEYSYTEGKLTEEKWYSEFSLNKIINYEYNHKGLLVKEQHFAANRSPGRKTILKRNEYGFITEVINFTASNSILNWIRYEYGTVFRDNWLKRNKFSVSPAARKKKTPLEAQYRNFAFDSPQLSVPQTAAEPEKAQPEPDEIRETTEQKQEKPSEKNTGTLTFDNGTYTGEISEGQMNGQGSYRFHDGSRYTGQFSENRMEGRGKLEYPDGRIFEGNFLNNQLNGPGACKWSNGDFYAGEFLNGMMHGKGYYIWENGNRFEGIFEENKRTDQGILTAGNEADESETPDWVNELFRKKRL